MVRVWAAVVLGVGAAFVFGCEAPDDSLEPIPRSVDESGPGPSAIAVEPVRILRGVEFVHERGASWVPGDSGSIVVRSVNGTAIAGVPFSASGGGEFSVDAPAFGRLMVSVVRPRTGVPTHVVLDPGQVSVDLREVATGRPDAILAEPGTRLRVSWGGDAQGTAGAVLAVPSAGLESPLFQDRAPRDSDLIEFSALQPPALLPSGDTAWFTNFAGTRAAGEDRTLETTWLEAAARIDGLFARNGGEAVVPVELDLRPEPQRVPVELDTAAFLDAARETIPDGTLGLVNVLWFAQAFREDVPMLLDLGDLYVENQSPPASMLIANPFPEDWPLARVTVLTVRGADGRFVYFYEAERPGTQPGQLTAPRTQPPRNVRLELTGGTPVVTWEAPAVAPDFYIVHLRDPATDDTLARWLTRDTRAVLAPHPLRSGQPFAVRVSAIRHTRTVDAWSTPLMDARQDLSRADAPELQQVMP